MHEMEGHTAVMESQPGPAAWVEEIEGLETRSDSWGDYPIDTPLIRSDTRTVHDVIRRIDQDNFVMDPEFQRDFIWVEAKQSKLIESVIMRIPLPVFYMAEDAEGKMVIVDGLQRLSTFHRFLKDELSLDLRNRPELHRKRFSELTPKVQNRVEDCNLTFYILDPKVPERARLDIFERVNGGEPLTRQQMRNSLYMGKATKFLKHESRSDIFIRATGRSLNSKTMRDREFVNRFCAFQLLDLDEYQGDMDMFLATCLRRMNEMNDSDLSLLRDRFRAGLENNFILFERHAFRKHSPEQQSRSVLNASLWDVMSTSLSGYSGERVSQCSEHLRSAFHDLLDDPSFDSAITLGTNSRKNVIQRFKMTRDRFQDILLDDFAY